MKAKRARFAFGACMNHPRSPNDSKEVNAMCWSCNPICGGCRPPRKRPVKCPECGAFNAVDLERGGRKLCVKCEADLTELATPKPKVCRYCGEICYNPCRKADQDPPGGEIGRCQVRVKEPL